MTYTYSDCLVTLHQTEGIGHRILHRITQSFDDTGSLLSADNGFFQQALSLSTKKADQIRQALQPENIERVMESFHQKKITAITLFDSYYPSYLLQIHDPPVVIYAKGDITLLQRPMMAMVGTRKPSSYGRMAAHNLARQLTLNGWVLVSGMAEGIDGDVHQAALTTVENPATVAVLGGGVDVVYPAHHAALYQNIFKKGCLLSESAPGTKPHKGLFPRRNRLISGLSHGVIVVEAAMRSGSLITADAALEQGRDVYAVPGEIFKITSSGTNHLIQQGAKLITSAEDVTEEYPGLMLQPLPLIKEKEQSGMKLLPEEKRILEVMASSQLHVNDIIRLTELMPQQIQTALVTLQLKKKIRQLPGAYYVKIL